MKKNFYRWTYRSLLILGTIFAVSPPASAQTNSTVAETLPSDSVLLARIDFDAIRNHPELDLLPWEVLQSASVEQIGLDVIEIAEIGIGVGMPSTGGPEGVFVLKFKNDVDIANVSLPNLGPVSTSPKKPDLKFRNIEGTPFKLMQLVPDSILVGSEGTLRRTVTGRFPSTKAIELLKESTEPVSVVVAFDLLRPLVTGLLEDNIPRLPEPVVNELIEMVENVDHLRIATTAGLSSKFYIDLYSADEDTTAKVSHAIAAIRDFGLQELESSITKNLQRENSLSPTVQQAFESYLTRVKNVLQQDQWQTNGNSIHYEVEGINSVGTIGVLTGMLLPAVQAAREAARRTQSANELKQFQLALLNYESAYRKFPARAILSKEGKPLLSWRVSILPYIEEPELYNQFKMDEPWDSPHNIKLLDRMPKYFENPRAGALPPGHTSFVAPYTAKTFWGVLKQRGIFDITDGTSNTIAIMETTPERSVPWTAPQDLDVTDLQIADFILPNGSNVAFFDGSVRTISSSIDLQTFLSLLSHQGGEIVPQY